LLLRTFFALAVAVAGLSCGTSGAGTLPDGVFHTPCGPLTVSLAGEVSAAQRENIISALGAWNSHGFTRLSVEGEGEPIALKFDRSSPVFHGFYDPQTGEVLINQEVEDPWELQVVVAHELGHAMGLAHVARSERPSVMNSGNLTLAPTPEDGASVRALCP
jgi:hypothetical protein